MRYGCQILNFVYFNACSALAKTSVQIPCNVQRFVDNILDLPDAHQAKIREYGLGCMLDMKPVKMRECLDLIMD